MISAEKLKELKRLAAEGFTDASIRPSAEILADQAEAFHLVLKEVEHLKAVQAGLVASLKEFGCTRKPGHCPPDHCRFERAAAALAATESDK